jgi:hypothetical protein
MQSTQMTSGDKNSRLAVSVGIICCRVLKREIHAVVNNVPEVTHVDVAEWGLHLQPDLLLETLSRRIRNVQHHVDAIMLGYGRCQALDRLPDDFVVPVVYPEGEDCIGVLLGQERYDQELKQTPGTWFLTPGWTELGMEFIFKELQVQRLAEKGHDPIEIAHRMLTDFSRALFINMKLNGCEGLKQAALSITAEFGWRLEEVNGSLYQLRKTLQHAIIMAHKSLEERSDKNLK